MPVKPPHPNAAIIFLNWFLSREGQAVAVRAMGTGSTRIDVPAEGVHPFYIPKPGEKYYFENEETFHLKNQYQEALKKAFAELTQKH